MNGVLRRFNGLPFSKFKHKLSYSVIGAGNGGQAMAADLALKGFRVTLFNRSSDRLEPIKKNQVISVEGCLNGDGKLFHVTTDPAEAALPQILMVVVPATGHAWVARVLAPHLRDGHLVVLNPGRTFGALEFEKVLREEGCQADVTIAEAQSLIYASRVSEPGKVKINEIKKSVPLATLPASRARRVISILRPAFPQFTIATDILETGLLNIGAIFHPVPVLMNAGWVEAGGDFEHYRAGISPSVSKVIEAMDEERQNIARACGVRTVSALKWLQQAYGVHAQSLHQALTDNKAYFGLKAPRSLQHRYVTEDVPTGLVPISALGKLMRTPTPVIDSVITLASAATGIDYFRHGRNLEKLGLNKCNPLELLSVVKEGRWARCREAANTYSTPAVQEA